MGESWEIHWRVNGHVRIEILQDPIETAGPGAVVSELERVREPKRNPRGTQGEPDLGLGMDQHLRLNSR